MASLCRLVYFVFFPALVRLSICFRATISPLSFILCYGSLMLKCSCLELFTIRESSVCFPLLGLGVCVKFLDYVASESSFFASNSAFAASCMMRFLLFMMILATAKVVVFYDASLPGLPFKEFAKAANVIALLILLSTDTFQHIYSSSTQSFMFLDFIAFIHIIVILGSISCSNSFLITAINSSKHITSIVVRELASTLITMFRCKKSISVCA